MTAPTYLNFSGNISCLFLDRDGVINEDFGYVHKKEHFLLCDGIVQVIKYFNSLDVPVVIITNQAGIGHGYYDMDKYLSFQDWIEQYLLSKGCVITKTYFSPYHKLAKVKKFRKNSWFRKPGAGMFYKAKLELDLNLSNSILIGDKITDIEAGQKAGIGKMFLIRNSNSFKINLKKNIFKIDKLEEIFNYV